jgi:hypothetical protein
MDTKNTLTKSQKEKDQKELTKHLPDDEVWEDDLLKTLKEDSNNK